MSKAIPLPPTPSLSFYIILQGELYLYSSQTYTSFCFLTFNLSILNFCARLLLANNVSLTTATKKLCSVSQSAPRRHRASRILNVSQWCIVICFGHYTRYKPKVSGLGQYNNFRLSLVTGLYCPLRHRPIRSLYPRLSISPIAGSISGTLFHDAIQHYSQSSLNVHDILKSL